MSSQVKKPTKLVKRRSSDSIKRARNSNDQEEASSQKSNKDSVGSSDADLQGINAISLGEFLELDPRPTFVVKPGTDFQDGFEPVLKNLSFRSNHQLNRIIITSPSNSPPRSPKLSAIEFRRWLKVASQPESSQNSDFPQFPFLGHVWTAVRLRQRYVIISGTLSTISGTLPLRVENANPSSGYLSEAPREARLLRVQSAPVANQIEMPLTVQSFVSAGTPDWTVASPEGDLSPHIIFARSIDWAATPLGVSLKFSGVNLPIPA
jgi:hypothetical protein